MHHAKTMTKNYEYFKREHDTMLVSYQKMSLDLDRLGKKEIEFDKVLANRLEYINKIDMQESKLQKLQNLDAHQKESIIQLDAEIAEFKQRIFQGEDREKDLREQIKSKDKKQGGLQARVNELQLENGEQSRKLSLLDDKFAVS